MSEMSWVSGVSEMSEISGIHNFHMAKVSFCNAIKCELLRCVNFSQYGI